MTKTIAAFAGLVAIALSAAGRAQAEEVDFKEKVLPILKEKCMDCHRAPYKDERGRTKKPKGDLRLDTAEMILKGSEDGKVVVPGKSGESSLYKLTTLTEDDDDVMPPKGDLLTKEQQEILKKWIDEGAKFGDWKEQTFEDTVGAAAKPAAAPEGAPAPSHRGHPAADDLYERLAQGAQPATEQELSALGEAGVQAQPLSAGVPLLRAIVRAKPGNTAADALAALSPHAALVSHLDLAREEISDADLKAVAAMPKLTRLDLRGTKVTDAGIAHLTGAKELVYLNLYGTGVTDAGAAKLAALPKLESVYLWGSKITEKGAAALQGKLPEAKIVWR
ncbi:MAG: c-type cytochrome domain-containing protein [Verrucomicrobiales bacterium]